MPTLASFGKGGISGAPAISFNFAMSVASVLGNPILFMLRNSLLSDPLSVQDSLLNTYILDFSYTSPASKNFGYRVPASRANGPNTVTVTYSANQTFTMGAAWEIGPPFPSGNLGFIMSDFVDINSGTTLVSNTLNTGAQNSFIFSSCNSNDGRIVSTISGLENVIDSSSAAYAQNLAHGFNSAGPTTGTVTFNLNIAVTQLAELDTFVYAWLSGSRISLAGKGT